MMAKENLERQVSKNHYPVINLRSLTTNTFILSLPKGEFKFIAGQHFNLSIVGEFLSREYSIYSAEESANLEILVKEVEGGFFSPKIKHLKPGDLVKVQGPFGRFRLDLKKSFDHKHIFIASGTGIAPFHSMVKSYPHIDYHLIHGVRFAKEAYDREDYGNRYTLCTSRDTMGNFNGRVTDYLKQQVYSEDTSFYICGNSEMIYDTKEILKEKGFNNDSIHVEVYF